MKIYSGLFELWRYSVSHGALLICRSKDETHNTRVEIMFLDVSYIDLPTAMHDIQIAVIDDPHAKRQLLRGARVNDEK
jgi:hypothetical protein